MTTLRRCPCCNSVAITVDGVTFGCSWVRWDGGRVDFRFRSHPSRLAWLLAARSGAMLATGEIIDALYGDDPDGGPLTAATCVGVDIWRLRDALRRAGAPLEIKNHWGRGYELIIHSQERIGVAA